MELSFWSKSGIERIYFNGAEGYVERRLAAAYSNQPNTFASTVPAEVFAEVRAFTGEGDDEAVFQNLKWHAANFKPIAMSAKSTKVAQAAQKVRVAAFAAKFGGR